MHDISFCARPIMGGVIYSYLGIAPRTTKDVGNHLDFITEPALCTADRRGSARTGKIFCSPILIIWLGSDT